MAQTFTGVQGYESADAGTNVMSDTTRISHQESESANLILIQAFGKVIGRAQSCSSEIQYGTQGVYEIGSIMPQEHVFLKYEGTLTLERVRVRKNSLVDFGLTQVDEHILEQGLVNIIIMDKYTQTVTLAYYNCSAVNYQISNRANELVTETLNMTYLSAGNNNTNNTFFKGGKFGY